MKGKWSEVQRTKGLVDGLSNMFFTVFSVFFHFTLNPIIMNESEVVASEVKDSELYDSEVEDNKMKDGEVKERKVK